MDFFALLFAGFHSPIFSNLKFLLNFFILLYFVLAQVINVIFGKVLQWFLMMMIFFAKGRINRQWWLRKNFIVFLILWKVFFFVWKQKKKSNWIFEFSIFEFFVSVCYFWSVQNDKMKLQKNRKDDSIFRHYFLFFWSQNNGEMMKPLLTNCSCLCQFIDFSLVHSLFFSGFFLVFFSFFVCTTKWRHKFYDMNYEWLKISVVSPEKKYQIFDYLHPIHSFIHFFDKFKKR